MANLRAECAAIQQTSNDVNQQLSMTHERYAEQVSDNSSLQIRVRELEQALTQVRLERESAFDQTVVQLREETRMAQLALDKTRVDAGHREREMARLQEVVDNQAAELARWKHVERQQNELFEAGSDERARLAATVRQQSDALDEQAHEVQSLRTKLSEAAARADQAEEERIALKSQIRELRALEEQMETHALGEFRRSRRHIEQRLDKLQSECAQVAHLMSPAKGGAGSAGGFGGSGASGVHERLPDWMPPAVATLVQSFRTNLLDGGRNVGEEMSSFLIALNRIWRERLEEKLRQVRLHHAADVRELKRRLAQRIPYEQVVQKARILRLQKDLDTTRAVHLKSRGDQSKGLLDLSLSTVENLSRQILEYERENSLLKNQVQVLVHDKSASGARASDSSQWLATATLSAVNSLGDKLWGNANTYMDKVLRTVQQSGSDNAAPRISHECELFLDSLEVDVRACKSAVKRALAEAEAEGDDFGASASMARGLEDA